MKKPISYRITDYNRALLPNRFLASLEDGVGDQDQWISKTGLSPGHPAWGILYHVLLATLSPDEFNVILETGTNWGSSTIVLAQALKDSQRPGKCVTIELKEENHKRAVERFKEAEVHELIEAHIGNSLEVLPKVLANCDAVRIAFLDGNHTYQHVLDEFELVLPKLAKGALVLFDNTYPLADEGEDPLVHGALKEIIRRHGGNIINLPYVSWYTPGMAIWQKSGLYD